MRTVDHKILAGILISRYMQNTPKRYKNAFFLGCIEPDYNPFSYFHGFLNSHTLYGHNFSNVKNYLEKLFGRLNNSSKHKQLFYFRLGLLIHYITDAFTHAHTSQFSGNLHQHNFYEQKLHLTFEKMITQSGFRLPARLLPCDSISEVNRLHNLYSKEGISVYNDLIFIFSLTGSIMEHFTNNLSNNVFTIQTQNNS